MHEAELVEMIAKEQPGYDVDDIYEAIIILETRDIVERNEINGAMRIELIG